MTKELWLKMIEAVRNLLDPQDSIETGGAAWADHIPVALLLDGFLKGPTSIWLPAPLDSPGIFRGPPKSAAAASNFYHGKFSSIIGEDSRKQILLAQLEGAWLNNEPEGAGYGGFFARNAKVAERAVDGCIALTWGEGSEPADGGTNWTWDRIKGDRIHISLKGLL